MALRSFRWPFATGTCMALTIIAACSDFTEGDDNGTGDSGPPTDAPSTDVATADAATIDGPSEDAPSTDAGRVNLFQNGDFELGCASWTATDSDPDIDTTARSPTRSCRVCSNASVGYALLGNAPVTAAPGARYVAEAYLRAAPDASIAMGMKATLLLTQGPTGGTVESGQQTSGPMLDNTWRLITAFIVITQDAGTNLRLDLASGTAGSCFLIDDAVLYRAQ
jgi:hypothetical protein